MDAYSVLQERYFGELSPSEFLENVFFQGLLANYAGFRIHADDGNTEWTHEMVDYARQLGRQWGFDAKCERHKWDMMWLAEVDGKKEPVLRFEHENKGDFAVIWDTVKRKLVGCANQKPTVLMLVGIVYPNSRKEQDSLLADTEKLCKDALLADSALLLVTDACYYSRPKDTKEVLGKKGWSLDGYVFTSQEKPKMLRGKRGCNPSGFYYAYAI